LLARSIGPFVLGQERLEPRAWGPRDARAELEQQAHNRQLVQLILAGSADKFELERPLRKDYGSNRGLAQKRADWVREQLTQGMPAAPAVMVLVGGPLEHGVRLTSADTAPDRSVAVCPGWRLPPSGFWSWLSSRSRNAR